MVTKIPIRNVDTTVTGKCWMYIENSSMSVEEAVLELKAAGNEIVSVDHENRSICVLDTQLHIEEDFWCCEYCPAASKSKAVILEHESSHFNNGDK